MSPLKVIPPPARKRTLSAGDVPLKSTVSLFPLHLIILCAVLPLLTCKTKFDDELACVELPTIFEALVAACVISI